MIKATPYPNTLDECIDVVNEMQRHYSDPRYSDALAWLIGEAKKAQRYRKALENIRKHLGIVAPKVPSTIHFIVEEALKDGY